MRPATSHVLAHLQSPASSCPGERSYLLRYRRIPDFRTGSLSQADPPGSQRAPTREFRLPVWYLEVHNQGCTYLFIQRSAGVSSTRTKVEHSPIDDLVPLIADAIVCTNFMRPVIMHPVAVICDRLPALRRGTVQQRAEREPLHVGRYGMSCQVQP